MHHLFSNQYVTFVVFPEEKRKNEGYNIDDQVWVNDSSVNHEGNLLFESFHPRSKTFPLQIICNFFFFF